MGGGDCRPCCLFSLGKGTEQENCRDKIRREDGDTRIGTEVKRGRRRARSRDESDAHIDGRGLERDEDSRGREPGRDQSEGRDSQGDTGAW